MLLEALKERFTRFATFLHIDSTRPMMMIIHVLFVMALLSSIHADPIPSSTSPPVRSADARSGARGNPPPTSPPARAAGSVAASPPEGQEAEAIEHHASRHAAKGFRSRALDNADENADEKPDGGAALEATRGSLPVEGEVGQSEGQGVRKPPESKVGQGEASARDAGISDKVGITDQKVRSPSAYFYQYNEYKPPNGTDADLPDEEDALPDYLLPEGKIVRARAEAIAKYPGQSQVKARAMAIADKPGQTADAVAIARGSVPPSPPNTGNTPGKKKTAVVVKGSIEDSKKLIQTLLQLIAEDEKSLVVPGLDSNEYDYSLEIDNNDDRNYNIPSFKPSPHFKVHPSHLGGENSFSSYGSWEGDSLNSALNHGSLTENSNPKVSIMHGVQSGWDALDLLSPYMDNQDPHYPYNFTYVHHPQGSIEKNVMDIKNAKLNRDSERGYNFQNYLRQPPRRDSMPFPIPVPLPPRPHHFSHPKTHPRNDMGRYKPMNAYPGQVEGQQIHSNMPRFQNPMEFLGGPSPNSRFTVKIPSKKDLKDKVLENLRKY